MKSGQTDRYVPGSGNSGYSTRHYDLVLTYRMGSNRLEGVAHIDAVATEQIDRLSLDLAGLKVSKVQVDGHRVAKFGVRGHKLQIRLARPIARGDRFGIDVTYSGNPRPVRSRWGDVGWEELTEGVIVAGQPNGAASWFPCNDHPSDKASYRISVTTDSPYMVISNGALSDRRTRASMTTWVFVHPQPMATYLATVQIGRYEMVEIATKPVRQRAALPHSLKAGFATDFGRQTRMMACFTELFGRYPFDAYTVVVVDDPLEIPLEAQGLSIFGSNHVDGIRTHERLVAHELAHQWFGNSLTVAAWQHIWLNEGFACYAEWLWSEEAGGPPADRLADRYWRRLADSPQDIVLADPGPELMFDDRVYKRGALALHALRRETGDDDFFDLIRGWAKANRHATVTTAMFVDHVTAECGAAAAKLLKAWLFERELPRSPAKSGRRK